MTRVCSTISIDANGNRLCQQLVVPTYRLAVNRPQLIYGIIFPVTPSSLGHYAVERAKVGCGEFRPWTDIDAAR